MAQKIKKIRSQYLQSWNKIICAGFVLIMTAATIISQTPNELQNLQPNQTIERELAKTETHFYKFNLKTNEFFQVRVEQKGIDVALKLTDTSGNVLAMMDSPNGNEEHETLSFVAVKAGGFVLEITGLAAKSEKGRYVVNREVSRMMMAKDKQRVEVERVFIEGMTAHGTRGQSEIAIMKLEQALNGWQELKDEYMIQLTIQEINQLKKTKADAILIETLYLSQQMTSESYKSALEKYGQASSIYEEIGDKSENAGVSYLGSGSISDGLGRKQDTLRFYDKALRFFQINNYKYWEATTLSNIGSVYDDLGEKQKALDYYNQSLPLSKEVGDKLGEATVLSSIGSVYSLEEKQKALEYYNQALPLFKAVQDEAQEATTLNNIGSLYSALGEKQKALEYYNQALALFKAVKDKGGEATTLNNIGSICDDLGEKQKALEYYDQALIIRKLVNDKRGEAGTLNNVGSVYNSLGENQKALEYYEQSLVLRKLVNDKQGEAATLNNMGGVYDSLGERQKALEYYNQALPLFKAVEDKRGEATTLNNIGSVYRSLEKKQKAFEYYNQALFLIRAVEDRRGEAGTLNNIGGIYYSVGEKQKALEYYNQSLPLSKAIGDKRAEAATLTNIGGIYGSLGEKQKAIEYYNQALPLSKAIGDKFVEAVTLNNIGSIYDSLGEKQKALEYFQTSLQLSKYVGDISLQAATLGWLRAYWNSRRNSRFAIFYGKQSVNLYQKLRKNIQGLDKATQESYLKTIENSYRKLADILIAQGRIAEAEQVLDMLKEEELFSYLRRDANAANKLDAHVALTADEKQAVADYEKYAGEITKAAEELGVLEKKKNALGLGKSLSAEDQKRYDELKRIYDLAIARFNKFLDELKIVFGKEDKRIAQVESNLLAFLKKQNEPRTVIISTIVGEDRLSLIVTTSDVQKAYQVYISATDLNKLVSEFRNAVRNPNIDPRVSGKGLYDKLFPEGLKKDLDNIRADTIVWSLDGTLRYVPMAALFDGEKYLVERYNQAVITLASRDKLEKSVNADREKWLAFGVGVSKAYEKFPALPAVLQELCSVVNDARQKVFCEKFQTKGVFDGLMYADEDFTTENFEDNIGKVSVVHISSHFYLQPGSDKDSYLLVGGGTERKYSVDRFSKLKEDSLINIELLTLSACNTAMTAGNKSNGVEIEGFGALAQNKGVKSVLATLWAVNDNSTGLLMTEFYKILEDNPTDGKARAMRSAQLKLIQGEHKTLHEAVVKRSEVIDLNTENKNQPIFKKDDKARYSHPFYWSPFVLSGNWR